MTPEPIVPIDDLTRPRPVRIAAFLGLLAHAVLVLLALLLGWPGTVVAAAAGVIAVGQLGGWLFVETRVTPSSDPRTDTGVPLLPAGIDRLADGR